MTAGLVHGMTREPVPPDWPQLTDDEVRAVLAGRLPDAADAGPPTVAWRSPRPFSAAALVRRGGLTLVVKRHDARVRVPAQLAVEHAFAAHLRARGVPAPAALRTADGASAQRHGRWVYEAHEPAPGLDLYRDVMSWEPYAGPEHARAAGAFLARLHLAAADFAAPARPPAVLTGSCAVIRAPDPVGEIERLAEARPGLARALDRWPWQADLGRDVVPLIARAAPALAGLTPLWGHGDWHPSNLTWTCDGPQAQVSGVFDFGLANLTFAAHDLAVALERAAIGWLDLAGTGRAPVDAAAIDALLDGYESVRPLGPRERAALPDLLPVAHVEHALSEIEYFAEVTGSAANADLAYQGYLLGHARWFGGPEGTAALDLLRARARRRPRPGRGR